MLVSFGIKVWIFHIENLMFWTFGIEIGWNPKPKVPTLVEIVLGINLTWK